MQDDTYTESYISTIGVDFVSDLGKYDWKWIVDEALVTISRV